jgi:hypothetical protein
MQAIEASMLTPTNFPMNARGRRESHGRKRLRAAGTSDSVRFAVGP